VENKYSRLHENYFRGKRELPIIRVRLLKRRGEEGGSKAWWPMEGSMLGGQWNVPNLVANGMFQAWWPMECSKFGGQWKVPCLVAIRMFQAWWPLECSKLGDHWKVKEKHLFTSSIFP